MKYTSTRNSSVSVDSAYAIYHGISEDGGLFVPCEIPEIDDLEQLASLDYCGRAKAVLSRFLTDFTDEELDLCVSGAYLSGRFDGRTGCAPVVSPEDGNFILELWHGPTSAFKDMALQILPRLLTVAAKKTGEGKEICILVATSGDTGKAALEGFKDVEGTKIMVFYPENGVSPMQKLQMTTQEGNNVNVCAIKGNFDDAQTGVKRIFTDEQTKKVLAENGKVFSSANSINWGRLVPQIVYYVSAYLDVKEKTGADKVNIVVPTGNFGNILAAYYAMKMGVPVGKLICASNRNNILTDFIKTGVYDRNRDFYTTISPSMDILISSNLERLLYHMSGSDAEKVKGWMSELNEKGCYTVDEQVKNDISELFYASCCDDELTKKTIGELYEKTGYLCDTHTAVAVNACHEYRKETGDNTPCIIASTASPFKFASAVLEAVGGSTENLNEFEKLDVLSEKTGVEIPAPLCGFDKKEIRFKDSCTGETMRAKVLDALGIKE
ncbi:MAG: threonine synthase [Clostridia bacterium]|nr:threonine synthase [Clostridia bacterium]